MFAQSSLEDGALSGAIKSTVDSVTRFGESLDTQQLVIAAGLALIVVLWLVRRRA